MKLIGLTGGVASGKSTVSQQLARLGFAIIDTDLIVRDLLEHDAAVLKLVEQEFGTTDRAQLRRIVFADAEKRRNLERILHPRVGDEVQERVAALERQKPKPKAAVVVVPLLFEVGWQKFLDFTIAVVSDERSQIDRLQARDGIDRGLALRMIQSQLPNEEKAKKATYVIENNRTLNDLKTTVDELVKGLESKLSE